TRLGEKLLRFNYMASITWSSLSLLVLLFYPFANKLVSPLLGLLALPYFIAMASDLKYCGYKRMDVLRIYGFNLILIPVNLAGTMNSLIQIITGTKGVFGRTPKVRKRTVAPMLFVLSPYAIVLLSLFTLVRDYQLKYWYNAAYAVLNITLALYAIIAYIGPINSISDIAVQVKPWFQKKPSRRSRRRSEHRGSIPQTTDWFSVLHYGNVELDGGRILADNRRAISEESRAVLLEEAPHAQSAIGIGGPSQVGDTELNSFSTYFQPVFELASMKVVGYEALSRFDDGGSVTEHLGDLSGKASIALERNMLLAALDAAKDLPKDLWLSLNTSADLLHREETLLSALGDNLESVIFEVKSSNLDHEESPRGGVELPPIPEGMSLAIDDGSPDPEGLGKLTTFNPAFVKIDRPWVRGIDRNAVNQTLVGGMVRLAAERGVDLIAEGIETEEELAVLLRLGVKYGQGYLLGRPAPLHDPS
ncbi:MAG: EAL domain-containing protein, partial [Acidimicrobiales bacterium]